MASAPSQPSDPPTSQFLRSTAMLVIWGGIDSTTDVDETALNAWWTNEHLAERLAIPGFLRTRRFYSLSPQHDQPQPQPQLAGSSQYLVCYEVSSLSTLTSPEYMTALNDPTPATQRYLPLLASMNRSACRILHSVSRAEFDACSGGGVAGTIAHIVFQPPSTAESRDRLRSWIVEVGWPNLVAFPAALAMHLLEHDDAASRAGSGTKSYDEVRFQGAEREDQSQDQGQRADQGRWMLLLEFAEPLGAPFGKAGALAATIVDKLEGLEAEEVECRLYSLICAMSE